jgi:hypothetical protein
MLVLGSVIRRADGTALDTAWRGQNREAGVVVVCAERALCMPLHDTHQGELVELVRLS